MSLYLGDKKVAGLSTNKVTTGFNIFDVKFSDHLINDIQWLRADTFSWQSGDVYVTAYNTLLEEYSNGVEETEEFIDEGLHSSIIFRRSPNGYKIVNVSNFNDATENLIQDKYNTDGVAWYYILDTTNKRFKLPRTKFGFKGLRDTVANDIDEKLPNIFGTIQMNNTYGDVSSASGSFKYVNPGNSSYIGTNSQTGKATKFDFNASRSSSTYQDNAPVQERGTQMYLYFYVGEYSRPAIEQTAGITSEQLNSKVDINASNLNTDGKSFISGLGMPSSKYINLTLGASGSIYTAPTNGWFYIRKTSGGTANYMNVGSGPTYISNTSATEYTEFTVLYPCIKGQQIIISYNATGNTGAFRFFYAQGEQ